MIFQTGAQAQSPRRLGPYIYIRRICIHRAPQVCTPRRRRRIESMDVAKDEAAGRSRPGTATRRHWAGTGDSSKRGGGDGDGVVAQLSFWPVSTPQRVWSEAIHGRVELSTASTGEATKPSAPMLGGAFSRLASRRESGLLPGSGRGE